MVFSYPGLGKLGVESAQYHDYNMLMLVSLITGASVIAANMLAQIMNEKLDPRFKHEEIRSDSGEVGGRKEWEAQA